MTGSRGYPETKRETDLNQTGAKPKIEIKAETHTVTADRELLVCEPTKIAADGSEVFFVLRVKVPTKKFRRKDRVRDYQGSYSTLQKHC